MYPKKLLVRLVSGALVTAVMAGSALLVSGGVAGATVPNGTLGSLTTEPASGTDVDTLRSTTSGPCPNDDANDTRANQLLVGPVEADGTAPAASAVFPDSDPYSVTSINSAQFSKTQAFVQQFNITLKEAARSRGKTLQVGEYHLTTNCLNSNGLTSFGTFTGGLNFDTPTHYTVIPPASSSPSPTPSPTPAPVVSPTPTPVVSPTPTPTLSPTPVMTPSPLPTPVVTPAPTPAPGATATTTTLNVIRVHLPFGLGGFAVPFAHVAPFNAAGTVQLKDGEINLGGPVPVAGGFAFGGFFVLPPARSHSLTAEFTPADPAAFRPSTSNTVTFSFARFRGVATW